MCVCVRERERARSGRQRIGKRNIGKVEGEGGREVVGWMRGYRAHWSPW